MSISLRIKEIRSTLKITSKDFATSLKIDNSQYSKIEQGKLMPTLNLIMEINSIYKISLGWLLKGKGDIFESGERYISHINEKIHNRKLVPFFDGITQAGTQVVANMDATYPVEMVDAGDFFQDATAIMAVHGDGMHPDYKAGTLVALKEVHNKRLIMLGQDYVVETSEYRVIKRLQSNLDDSTCWLACSTNTGTWEQGTLKGRLIHEPFTIPIDEVIRVHLVLGQISRNHSSKIIYNR